MSTSKAVKRGSLVAAHPQRSGAVNKTLKNAEQLIAGKHFHAANDALLELLRQDQKLGEAHHLLAVSALMAGDAAQALIHAETAVEIAPKNAQFHFTLGRACKAENKIEDAISAYRRSIELRPQFAEAHVSLGIALKTIGDLEQAIACYRRALKINPDLAAAHANLGNALAIQTSLASESGNEKAAIKKLPEEIEAAQRRALELDPQNALLNKNLGISLMHASQYQEAAKYFNQALGHAPADEESCIYLGRCLRKLGHENLIRTAYEKWLNANPPSSVIMRELSTVLNNAGEAETALDWAQRAFELKAEGITLMTIAGALLQSRRHDESLQHFRQAIAMTQQRADSYPAYLMSLCYVEEDVQKLVNQHKEFGRRLIVSPSQLPRQDRIEQPRLRIGYVSGDLHRHSVSYFIEPVLQSHDRARFEVFCYHNCLQEDDVTQRLKGLGHHWIDCAEMTDDELFERIQEDGIDVLIDLSGHTANGRLPLFARRPAPVQMTYLGYPTITGMPAIDFRITDHVIDPPDHEQYQSNPESSEAALRCTHTMFCYRPDAQPETGEPPYLRNGWITFGSFNNLAKLSDRTLELWADVLKAVPDSHLFLKTRSLSQPANQANIKQFFAQRGIEPERILCNPWKADLTSHLELYREVDIALDCFPYNGATTTCETLWMGVPVVTRVGATHPARMGASILHAIDRPEWIAHTDQEYVEIAVRLADDAMGLMEWRGNARARLKASPLMDEQTFTRGFEQLVRGAWQRKFAAAIHPREVVPSA